MKLYKRPGDRSPVLWEPDDTDIGKQAVESVTGAVEAFPADVTAEEAAQIRAEYWQLIEQQSSGGSS
mgnify:CR=1 FL=1